MSKMHIKKGDTVVVLSGKYENKFKSDEDSKKKVRRTGKVLEVAPKEGKVIVEGINFVTKHVKPKAVGQQGGIVKAEAPMYACKVQLVCPKCGKPTRVGHVINKDGDKKRVCKKCSTEF